MINFEKINKMIDLIEESQIMEGLTFNEFAMEFYSEVKLVPLSRYLKTNNRVKRMPKIMNMRKAGELLLFTKTDDETLSFLKRKGYSEIPSLDYKTIMLLRKLDPIDNWKKVLAFFNGDKTVEEINLSTRPILFPQEIKKLEDYIKDELSLNDDDFEKFMNFLGHSLISLEIDENTNKETLYGNFTGDFYKGLVERIELSENLKEGIILHRIIDKNSDRKENLLNELLTEKFGIFKGIVSDMFIDHFLSKNFNNLFNKNIDDIERKILSKVGENKNIFPKDFERTFDWLNDKNVMTNYKDIDFLERAFQGLARNVRKGEILNSAVAELKKNYNLFEEKSIKEFFYVKKESIEKFLKKISCCKICNSLYFMTL